MTEDSLTLADVLDLEYPGEPSWSADGEYVAATVYQDDGNALLVADPTAKEDDAWWFHPDDGDDPSLDGFVAEFAWAPHDPRLVAATEEGAVLLVDADERTVRELASHPDGDASLTWSNAGDRLACYRDGDLWVTDVNEGTAQGFDAPERGPFLGEARMIDWREDDARLAYRFVDHGAKQVGVVDPEEGELVWRTHGPASRQSPAWLADGRLLFVEDDEYGTVRRFVVADLETGDRQTLFEERDDERGTISRGTPQVSPDGTRIGTALPVDGWTHVHVFDAETGERTQLTEGTFEDAGVAGANPRWVDDETLVFASNRRDLGQRQLFAVDTSTGSTWPVIEFEGTSVHPRPSPDGSRVAYIHADTDRSPELRVASFSRPGEVRKESTSDVGDSSCRLTRSRVENWPVEPVEPELVSIEREEGTVVRGYLLDPRRTDSVPDDATDLPLVVYVHGGPMRQMRAGWHPSRSYGLAYATQQYLATRGYVGLFPNYRGGIGYGAAFRKSLAGTEGDEEMADVVALTEHVADREYVDGDAAGIWGLSYGGYATLQLLGTDPDAFAVGVNLAGVADRPLYQEWATETKFPEIASSTPIRQGGHPEEVPESWAASSPVTHLEHVEAPLYNFHGTDDRYVNVEQQDAVVDCLLELDIDFETEYYPGEAHVFRRRAVWERTLEKTEEAFEEHLDGT